MKNINKFFITSTGTELGKTFISVKIINYFLKNQQTIDAYKPILSGFNNTDLSQSDSGLLLNAKKEDITLKNINTITPWLFKRPLAPTIAAKYEKKKIFFKNLKNWCYNIEKKTLSKYLLFEGAGGLMVPIEGNKTFIDLFRDIRVPVILVVGSYLGTISHTLSAVENLYHNKIDIINIIFNEGKKVDKNFNNNFTLLRESLRHKIKLRPFSHNTKFHRKQLKVVADDIIEYFK